MKLVLTIFLSILFLLVGCTPTNEALTELTGNPNSNTIVNNNNSNVGNQAFAFTPSSYDFGNRAVGAAAVSTAITVTNSSGVPMYISSISGGNAPFSITSDNCARSPIAVPANASCTVNVSFQPTGGGLFNMTLAVTYGTNTANTSAYSAVMGISGSGVGTLAFAGIDSVSNIYSTQLQLNWTHVAGALTYFVIRVNGDGTSTLVANVTPPTATYIVSGLTALTTYRYWVRASDTLGALDTNTNIVTTTTTNTPPAPDIAVEADYVYPSTALTVGNTLNIDSNDVRTGSATDAGITYSCYYDTTIDGVVAAATACSTLNGTASYSTTSGIFLWTPSSAAIGFYEIKITATDNISALTDNTVFKVDVVPAYTTTNLKTSLMAAFSNITYQQIGGATTWEDVTTAGNDGTLENFAFLGSDGWFGANTIASPYRLVLDGSGRVDVSNILSGMTKFATTSWIAPTTTTAGISAVYQSGALNIKLDDGANGRYQVNFGKNYRDVILSQTPIAYYEFNESSGTTASDSSGNGYDGTHINGTSVNQTNCPTNGNTKNGCVDFDGTNDYTLVSNAAINAVFNAGNSFSYSLWYYPEELPAGAWHDIFDRAYSSHVSPYYNVTLRMNATGIISASLWNTAAGTYLTRASAAGLALYQWYHIGVVVNLTASTLELFINGVSQGVHSTPAGTYVNHGQPLTIGTNKNLITTSYTSNGKMDEVAIFASPLTAAQILAQYQAGINYNSGAGLYPYNAVMQDRPVAYYRLGESSGTNAYDSSGNGNHGTYVGTVTKGVSGSYNPTDSNTAVTFDGATGFVKIMDQTPFNFTGSFTLEAWVKGTDTSQVWHAISRYGIANTEMQYTMYMSAGVPYFGIAKADTLYSAAGSGSVLDGAWHHLVGTNDGSILKMYVDGVLVGTNTNGGVTDLDSVYTFLGARVNTGTTATQFTTNTLDEVAIYNYALTNSQVLAHYTQSSYNFCKVNKSYLATEHEFISALYDGTLVTVFTKNIEQCSFKPTTTFTSTPNVVLGSRSDTSQVSAWIGSIMDFKLYATSDGSAAATSTIIKTIYDNTEAKYKTRPDSVAGLLFWYRPENFIGSAHGSTVSTWADNSGNNYSMTNSAAAGTKPTVMARAVNNYPALLFDSAQYFDMPSSNMDATTSHTFFIVHHPNDATGAIGYFIWITTGTLVLGDHLGVPGNNGFNDGAWKHFALQSGWQIQTWTFDGSGSSATVYVNGTLKYSGAHTPSTINGAKFFGSSNTSSQYLRAQVAEVIGYTGVLNSTNRQATECYLAKKFNITLSYTCSGN